MPKRTLLIAAALMFALVPSRADPLSGVDVRGLHPKVKTALTEFGHLAELNGKYQMRVTEITIDRDGGMGAHHHLGPGIRCISAGELTYTIQGKTTVYKPGDCFAETGDITHDSRNDADTPVVLLNFEILPASVPASKGSIIAVPHSD